MRLYCAIDPHTGGMLAKQATQIASTIGGVADRSRLPSFTVDAYTGADLSWAFNAPVLQINGAVLTIGRSITSTAILIALAAATRSATCVFVACVWFAAQFTLIQLLKLSEDDRFGLVVAMCNAAMLACAPLIALWAHSSFTLVSANPFDACRFAVPSLSAWAAALGVHGLLVCIAALLGAILYALPRRSHMATSVALLVGVAAAMAAALVVIVGRRHRPDLITWMVRRQSEEPHTYTCARTHVHMYTYTHTHICTYA